ncbi:MAG: RNase P subunit p30 family protein [archaeon]
MDIVYAQPLKELLQVSTYFKEKTLLLVSGDIQYQKAKQSDMNPCLVLSEKDDLNNTKGKMTAVVGGSIKSNEFAVKIKADFLLQPSNTKQFFDLGLAQKLTDNNTTVVLMFEELLEANSFERHAIWKNFIEIVAYCKKKKTRFIVASGCKDPLHLRPRKVRESLAVMLGLEQNLAQKYLEDLDNLK